MGARNRRIWIRVNDTEYKEIKKYNGNFSAYVRFFLMNKAELDKYLDAIEHLREIKNEMHSIGKNLNQVTRAINLDPHEARKCYPIIYRISQQYQPLLNQLYKIVSK